MVIDDIWRGLIANLAIVALFTAVWSQSLVWLDARPRASRDVLTGGMIGVGAVSTMLLAIKIGPGVFFDLRLAVVALGAFAARSQQLSRSSSHAPIGRFREASGRRPAWRVSWRRRFSASPSEGCVANRRRGLSPLLAWASGSAPFTWAGRRCCRPNSQRAPWR